MPKPFNRALHFTGKMPFGPHKGKALDDVPIPHLYPLVTRVNPRKFPELFQYLQRNRERIIHAYSELKRQQDFFNS